MKKTLIILLLFLVVALIAYSMSCPTCGLTLFWTGGVRVDGSKHIKQYKCLNGHEYWYPMKRGEKK